jgi:adenylyltransferase/sulfurtransferase
VDDDVVELTNLQRQVVHRTADIGRPKAESAAEAVAAVNPGVVVRTHATRLTAELAVGLLEDYDLVVDGADNFPTRYAVASAAQRHGIPHVWGSVFRFDGQVRVWWPPHGPCYACVFPEAPAPEAAPSCSVGGVFGAVCASIGSVLATEAIKLITGVGEPLVGRLLLHDALGMRWSEIAVQRHPGCPLCQGDRPGSTPVEVTEEPVPEVDIAEVARAAETGALVVDVREAGEREIVTIPGALWVTVDDIREGSAGLPHGIPVYVHCKTGARSRDAVRQLRAQGVDARSVRGGVLAWVSVIDPTLPTY